MRKLALLALLANTACSYLGQIAWSALDQAGGYSTKPLAVADIDAGGARVVRVVNGINFPSAMAWDDKGRLFIVESHTVPAPILKARVIRVDGNRIDTLVTLPGETAIGITFHDGWLYVSHEEKDATFSISRIRPDGSALEPVVRNLPTQGDHDVNYLTFANDGSLWFGVGSASNSGVIAGDDPVNQKWLTKHPDAHDVACRDIALTGQKFTDKGGTTGAYQPYKSADATRIAGAVPCTGAVFRVRPGSTTPELVAWGFRNPVAIVFDDAGNAYVAMQGADTRSTRPVVDDPDAIYALKENAWYGWPDYRADFSDVTPFVIDHTASGLTVADRSLLVTPLTPHAAVCGVTFTRDGKLLIAEMGDFKPMTDNAHPTQRAGFQIESVDVRGGAKSVFARNRGTGASEPASKLDLRNGFERPVDVKIGPDGNIYVLDFGAFVTAAGEPKAMPKTGKVFRIESR